MRAVAVVVVAFVLMITVGACVNAPLPVTPEPGAPCGISYVTCATPADHGRAWCCGEYTECCDGSICPAGFCEATGETGPLHKGALTPQFHVGSR